MKPIVKVALVLSGIFVVLGIAGITAGTLMGIPPSYLLDLNHVDPVHISRLPDLPRIGLHREDASDHFWNGESNFEGYFGDEHTTSLALEAGHCELHIYSSDESLIYMEGKNDTGYFSCKEEDGLLTITDRRPETEDPFELHLYLPERVFEEITLDVEIGEISIEQLQAERLTVDLSIGTLEADLLDAQDLILDVGIGDMYCTVPGSSEDYRLDLNNSMGEISLDGRHHGRSSHDQEHYGIGSHLTQNPDADRYLEANCDIGSIGLTFSEEE